MKNWSYLFQIVSVLALLFIFSCGANNSIKAIATVDNAAAFRVGSFDVAFAGKKYGDNFSFKNKIDTLGYTSDSRLEEISGIVASRTNKGLFWVHNDSGNDPNIYLVDSSLKILQTIKIESSILVLETSDENAVTANAQLQTVKNVDWEDITIATENEENFIIVADIGDNKSSRESVFLYKFKEPEFIGDAFKKAVAEKMTIKYKEGPRDAEVILFDPKTKDLIIVSKRDAKSKVYAFPFVAKEVTIVAVGELDLRYCVTDDGHVNKFTGGDIDSFGNIIIKNYSNIFLFTNQKSSNSSYLLLNSEPQIINYVIEPQGEAICWGVNELSYYTISENRYGKIQPLIKYY